MGTPPIEMANLGMADSLILMVMALVVFGPRRLPQIGRQIGKLMYEFRKASNDFKFQMEEELRTSEEADRRKKEEDRLRALTAAAPPQIGLMDGDSLVSEVGHEVCGLGDGDSQVSEARSGAPDLSGLAENSDGRGREPIKLDTPIDETYPRIMPPSSGEQVAAARPHGLSALAQAANESGAAVAVGEEDSAEQSTADPEQAAHHDG